MSDQNPFRRQINEFRGLVAESNELEKALNAVGVTEGFEDGDDWTKRFDVRLPFSTMHVRQKSLADRDLAPPVKLECEPD